MAGKERPATKAYLSGEFDAKDPGKIPGLQEHDKKRIREFNKKKRVRTLQENYRTMLDRSTRGSPPFSDAEMKTGYRSL